MSLALVPMLHSQTAYEWLRNNSIINENPFLTQFRMHRQFVRSLYIVDVRNDAEIVLNVAGLPCTALCACGGDSL